MTGATTATADDFEAVIGLEVHVQLRTAEKMFCRCPNAFGGRPNGRVCEVCLGYPGALPVVNPQAVEQAVRLAAALGATVERRSAFDRKSYFYADQPKGYQITQHERPLARGGSVPPEPEDAGDGVEIVRLHLEEDAGRLLHDPADAGGRTRIDFDRSGVPLVEIVTAPSIRTPAAAEACLRSLHRLLLHTATSDANLEQGSLRCDANVSLRRRGSAALGTRCEVKNLNSFRHVARALEHEIARQGEILRRGGTVRFETRSFDAGSGTTRGLRSKEGEPDYRYFPEPDLPPLVLSDESLRRLEESLPELPAARRARYVAELGLGGEEAAILVSTPEVATYFDRALAAVDDVGGPDLEPRTIGHWVSNHVLRTWPDVPPPVRLVELIALVAAGELSSTAGVEVYDALVAADDSDPRDVARRLDLFQVRDDRRLAAWIDAVLAAHPDEVAAYRGGKRALLGFFVGGVMRRSGGAADPQRARRLLVDRLDGSDTP